MKLTPVIEFSPELFLKEDRDYPSIELKDGAYRKAREEFWYAMLADWGVTDARPYVKGSEFVKLSDISDQTLGILLDRELEEFEPTQEVNPDEICAFNGGIVFEDSTHTIFPSCCGDLGNFSEWEGLARSPIGEVKEVWIGHPWIDVEGQGDDKLRLSMRCDHSSELLLDLVISQAELLQNIEKAKHELLAFKERVKAELNRKSYPSELAFALTRLKNEELR